jgi:hypothetical protein
MEQIGRPSETTSEAIRSASIAMQWRFVLPVWAGALHNPDLLPSGVCRSLRRPNFVHPVKPVAQPTRDGSADGVGFVGVDLNPDHTGKSQPPLSTRARGGIATPVKPT